MLQAPLCDEPAREALCQATAALDAAEQRGQAVEISQALARVATCYRSLRALASAEACFEMALRWVRPAGGTDPIVDLLCELAETAVQRALEQEAGRRGDGRAARERARDHAFEAATRAGGVADPGWEAAVLLRISDVLDRAAPNITVWIDKLERRELIERERSAVDRRAQHIRTTAKGAALARNAAQRLIDGERQSFDALSPAETAMLIELLHKCC